MVHNEETLKQSGFINKFHIFNVKKQMPENFRASVFYELFLIFSLQAP